MKSVLDLVIGVLLCALLLSVVWLPVLIALMILTR